MDEHADPQRPLIPALRMYAEARESHFLRARRELGMSDSDARALVFVSEHPGTRAGALAQHLAITSAATTSLIDRLSSRGVIERAQDPDDRRALRLVASVDTTEGPYAALFAFDRDMDASASSESEDEQGAAAALVRRLLPDA